jgi:putative SbcD/Mre11-related phosphoesterase
MNTVLLREGILLDARHAAWFPEPAILAVADLHLGYAWAHRHSGNLLPLGTPSEDLARLESLLADYPIRELVLLGDIVHTAAPVEPLRDLLSALLAFETRFNLHIRWIAGNHDRHLPRLTNRWRLPIHLLSGHIAGGFHFIHGDTPPPTSDSPFYVMGHEHPSVILRAGPATSAKCPAFLAAPTLLVLPAFSPWAAGTVVGKHPFLSPLCATATFESVAVVVAGKILPIPYRKICG